MERSAIRMVAQLIDLKSIIVKLSNNYYSGQSDKFYLHDLSKNTFEELNIDAHSEDESYNYYILRDIEGIDLTHDYQVVDTHGLAETLTYGNLIHMKDFDDEFYYPNDDLGATYAKEQTVFKLWAPTALHVMVKIERQESFETHMMTRGDKGVFSVEVSGDLDKVSYTYLVKHHDAYIETIDPYALGSRSNSKASVVINPEKLLKESNRDFLIPNIKKQDAILYEISVRDFTKSESINAKLRGKFLGMVERGLVTENGSPAGLDYLMGLGITHVQLLPIFDFATVEENNVDTLYNWGYDPAQYGVPEGSYCTDPEDGYNRIIECQTMIAKLHQAGLRVVMDVVYNHVYDINASAFERTVPGYYFRKDTNGYLCNGSLCGNDFNSDASMARKYIVDMSKRWQQLYGVDGYRFDLMGIVDVVTLNSIYEVCSNYDPDFIMYGEGWDMNTALPEEMKGYQFNHALMPNISFFNDDFRDCIKGGSSDEELGNKGWIAGNMHYTENSINYLLNTNRYTTTNQSINYVECHDNATTYDKLLLSNGDEGEAVRRKRQLMMTEFVLVAQGVPFIHAGQEFYRQKNGCNNSYNESDAINAIDWNLIDDCEEDLKIIKKMIELRKKNKCFMYNSREETEANIDVECVDFKMLIYRLEQDEGEYGRFVIYINPSDVSFAVETEKGAEFIVGDEFEDGMIMPLSFTVIGYKRS